MTGLALSLLINFWALITGVFWLENTSYLLFFLFAMVLVLDNYRNVNKLFYFYLGFALLSYVIKYFNFEIYSNEVALVFLTVANTFLILEAVKHIHFKNGSNLMMLYFFGVVGFNGVLLGYHVLEMKDYIHSEMVFTLYIFHYLNLLILGITSFIYYLNSYSRKSMFFISLALGLIFADVLRDMGIFYLKDFSVEVAESIIRLGCAVFVMFFFTTKERQLRLVNLM